MKSKTTIIITLAILLAAAPTWAQTRLKDIANVQGVRGNQLVGYGLVVGLNGTGDGSNSAFTSQSIKTMLQKFGVNIATAGQPKNSAAVMVTASLPAFTKNGSTIDVVVSSLGDAKSLQGGTLIQTALQAANGQVYAVAQGSISVGGFSAGGAGGSVVQNHPTAGRIPAGALVEQEVPTTFAGAATNSVQVTLDRPDFKTAANIEEAIRKNLPSGATGARALDGATVEVDYLPGTSQIGLIADLEELPIATDEAAKVVINERTGTVVMGGAATVSACAIAHGTLTVAVSPDPIISQPAPFSKGQTVVVQHDKVKVTEKNTSLIPVPTCTTLDKVVRSMNALGVTPRDLIAILQAMKEAGALHAEIEVQ